jgi:hypothetical protein
VQKPKSKPKGRAASPAAREAQSARLAAGVLAGEPVTAIAESEGISRTWASNRINSSEVQLVTGMVDLHRIRLDRLFSASLDVIEQSFEANQLAIEKTRDRDSGELTVSVSVLGPDHYARLTGAKRLAEILTAGRPVPKPDAKESRSGATLQEIEELLSKRRVQ